MSSRRVHPLLSSLLLVLLCASGCSLSKTMNSVFGETRTLPDDDKVDFGNRHAPELNPGGNEARTPSDTGVTPPAPEMGGHERNVPMENPSGVPPSPDDGAMNKTQGAAGLQTAQNSGYPNLGTVPPVPEHLQTPQAASELGALTNARDKTEASRQQLMTNPDATSNAALPAPGAPNPINPYGSDPAALPYPDAAPMQESAPKPLEGSMVAPAFTQPPQSVTPQESSGFGSWVHHLFSKKEGAAPVTQAQAATPMPYAAPQPAMPQLGAPAPYAAPITQGTAPAPQNPFADAPSAPQNTFASASPAPQNPFANASSAPQNPFANAPAVMAAPPSQSPPAAFMPGQNAPMQNPVAPTDLAAPAPIQAAPNNASMAPPQQAPLAAEAPLAPNVAPGTAAAAPPAPYSDAPMQAPAPEFASPQPMGNAPPLQNVPPSGAVAALPEEQPVQLHMTPDMAAPANGGPNENGSVQLMPPPAPSQSHYLSASRYAARRSRPQGDDAY